MWAGCRGVFRRNVLTRVIVFHQLPEVRTRLAVVWDVGSVTVGHGVSLFGKAVLELAKAVGVELLPFVIIGLGAAMVLKTGVEWVVGYFGQHQCKEHEVTVSAVDDDFVFRMVGCGQFALYPVVGSRGTAEFVKIFINKCSISAKWSCNSCILSSVGIDCCATFL